MFFQSLFGRKDRQNEHDHLQEHQKDGPRFHPRNEKQQKMQYSGNRQHPPADTPPKASDVVMGKVPGLTVLHRSGGSVAVETVDLFGRVLLKKSAKADHGRGYHQRHKNTGAKGDPFFRLISPFLPKKAAPFFRFLLLPGRLQAKAIAGPVRFEVPESLISADPFH